MPAVSFAPRIGVPTLRDGNHLDAKDSQPLQGRVLLARIAEQSTQLVDQQHLELASLGGLKHGLILLALAVPAFLCFICIVRYTCRSC